MNALITKAFNLKGMLVEGLSAIERKSIGSNLAQGLEIRIRQMASYNDVLRMHRLY